jgi:hypothetical protein
MPITLLERNTVYKILRFAGSVDDRHHLASMGIISGAEISIIGQLGNNFIMKVLEALENKTDTFNKSHRFSVSYAHGYVLSVTGKYATPEELQKISDKHMYQRKQYMKENGLCAMR